MLDIDLFKLKATTRSLWMLLMDTSKYHGKFIMFSKTSRRLWEDLQLSRFTRFFGKQVLQLIGWRDLVILFLHHFIGLVVIHYLSSILYDDDLGRILEGLPKSLFHYIYPFGKKCHLSVCSSWLMRSYLLVLINWNISTIAETWRTYSSILIHAAE